MKTRRFHAGGFRLLALLGLTLVLTGASDSCDETRVVTRPDEILVAQNSVFVELTDKVTAGRFQRPDLMRALSSDALRKVGMFKWSGGKLTPLRFTVSGTATGVRCPCSDWNWNLVVKAS